jgi:hypothetical protein
MFMDLDSAESIQGPAVTLIDVRVLQVEQLKYFTDAFKFSSN